MHWTRFVQPGWRALACTDLRAHRALRPRRRRELRGDGLAGLGGHCDHRARFPPQHEQVHPLRPAGLDRRRQAGRLVCARRAQPEGGARLAVYSGWEYPSATDGWFEQQPDANVGAGGALDVEIEADCMYTFTTVGGVSKPPVPTTTPLRGVPTTI